ncbi:PepSY-associated TM helix domain-containing protein [Salinimonas chungwhensis]|uniref:PepSY-associated TM helix domain-containing protein n=1 Tax=Salinimonas chungwhensis TaxID=265425 RepID=UPI00039E1B76|nr:PepSY-associated TM helix domain-containing protein [Salinimonas chungwhensis]
MGRNRKRKSLWGDIRSWHWISSAICLAGLLMFAVTGITLNHADFVESKASVQSVEKTLPAPLLKTVNRSRNSKTLPLSFEKWMDAHTGLDLNNFELQWSEYELYGKYAQPATQRWFSLDLETGTMYQESVSGGWIAFFNDLHKGRNTGFWWQMFLDLFSVATLIFAATGLWLLKRYAKGRQSTWPLVFAGIGLPALMLFISTTASAAESELTVQIQRQDVAEYHNPYLAIWLADTRHQKLMNIKVLYDGRMANSKGEKWLKDLRLWWRRAGRFATLPIDGVSGATRPPGSFTVNLSPYMNQLTRFPAGDYFIFVEAARELGGRELVKIPLQLPFSSPVQLTRSGRQELGTITLKTEP